MISVKSPQNMSTAHNYRKRKSDEVNETKDDELNGKPKRMGCVAQEKDTAQTHDSSQMTIKQEPDEPVPAEALERIKHLEELNEKLSKELERMKHLEELNEKLSKEIKESRVNNQQSVGVVAESSQTSLKEVVIPLRKRRDRMAKEDRMKIISKMPFLIEQLNPEHLISTMFSKFLICEDEADELRTTFSTKGRKICAENMLYMLIRCGPYAYKIFLKCLELTGYRKVIEELEPNCEIYEGNIKYPGHQYYELIDNKNPKREEFIKKAEVNLEDIYESTEFVVIRKLTKGCVQVTFHLISLGSKNENELREVLESKVKSGYIGDSKVSTEGFSFKKIERGLGEEIDTDRNGEDQDSQLVSQENFIKLKRKIEELQGFNSRLRMHIAELETELEDQEIATDRKIDLENDTKTLKLQINELQRKNADLKKMEKYTEHEVKIYKDKIQEQEVIICSLQKQLDEQRTDSGLRKYLTIPIADDPHRDLAPLPIDDKQDKDKVEKGEAPLPIDDKQDKDKVEKVEEAERLDQDKITTLLTKDDDQDKDRVKKGAGGSESPARISHLFTPLHLLPTSMRSEAERLDPDKNTTLLTKDDDQDKDRVEKGAGGSQSLARKSHQLTSSSLSRAKRLTAERKITQLIDYLVTCHGDKLRPLVQLLKVKDAIDDDERRIIIKYIDSEDIKQVTGILSIILIRRPNSYQCLVESVKQLGLSDILDMIDKAERKIRQLIDYLVTCHGDKLRPLVQLLKDKDAIDDDDSRGIIMYIDRKDIKQATWILSTRLTRGPNSHQYLVECVKELGLSDVLDMIDKASTCRQIIGYLVTCHRDKLRPLVQLLKDKDVIDDVDSRGIIEYIDRGDIKWTTRKLSATLTRRPNSYQYLVECVKQLGLSDVLDMIDKGNVDIFTSLGRKKSGLMRFDKHKKDLKEQETKNISTGFSAHTSQSPDWIPVSGPSFPIIPSMVPESTDRKVEQIIDYLATHHPDKVRQLVQLLKDKGDIDVDDSRQIIMYIDKDDINMTARILSTRLSISPNSYQYLVECVKQLGLSDVEAMLDKDSADRKIRQLIDYLVTCHRDKLRPLVQLLVDKHVLDDDDSRRIIMYMDTDDINMATWILSSRLTLSLNSYQCLVESVKQLGLSDLLDMIDKGDVDILKPPISVEQAIMDKFDVEQLKPLGTKKPDLTRKKDTSQSRSSPD